jgi:hypothetical protein
MTQPGIAKQQSAACLFHLHIPFNDNVFNTDRTRCASARGKVIITRYKVYLLSLKAIVFEMSHGWYISSTALETADMPLPPL